MAALLTTLSNVFTLTFAVTMMLAMGLSLTVAQIVAPLRNVRLVVLALAANFVVVPAAAFLLSRVIPLEKDLQIGLILFGIAAGAPFLPKLAQLAKGNVAFAVGLMTLLMVVTVVFLPLALPLLLPGVPVNAGQIALTLVLEMLVPLGIGLFVKVRYAAAAAALQSSVAQISNVSLVLLLVLMLGLNLSKVLGLLGSGGILATLLLIGVAVASGYFAGGPAVDTRHVLALGTGQRNVVAGFVIAAGNFASQPDVLALLAAASLISMIVLMPLATELGRRAQTTPASVRGPATPAGGSAA